MRKISLILCLISMPIFLLSCGGPEEVNSDAVITLTSKKVYLIPNTTSSCKAIADGLATSTAAAKDITSKYFTLRNVSLAWNGPTDFAIAYIQVSFQSAQLTISSVIISEDELKAAITGFNGTIPAGGTLTTSCNLKIGGIAVSDDLNQDFEFTATVKMVGSYLDGTDEKPASTTQEFTVVNTKI